MSSARMSSACRTERRRCPGSGKRMRLTSTSSSSAASRLIACRAPWPISVVAQRSAYRPSSSRSMRIDARLGVCMPFRIRLRPLPRRSSCQPIAAAAASRHSAKWTSCMVSPVQYVSPSRRTLRRRSSSGSSPSCSANTSTARSRRPCRLHLAVAAKRAGRRQVGVDAPRVDADVRDAVRPRRGEAHLLRDAGAAVGVRAGVGEAGRPRATNVPSAARRASPSRPPRAG